MKKLIKLIFMLLIVIMILFATKPTFAQIVAQDIEGGSTSSSTDIFTDVKNRMDSQNGIGQKQLVGVGAPIIAFIRNLALVLGVIILSIIGIKYMIGSAEEKANYKKTLIPLVVGIIIVVSATTIVGFVYDAVTNAVNKETRQEGGEGGGGSDAPTDPHLGPDIRFDDI